MKTKNKVRANILRSSAAMLLFSCAVVTVPARKLPNYHANFRGSEHSTASDANGQESTVSLPARAIRVVRMDQTLSFADRVAYQRAIEDVYWQHRIWPKENARPKPPLDKVMSHADIEKKVEDYLRNSYALEDYWQRPITPDQLQAEMERIASHTKQPGVLREIIAALGNDPLVIAECLARPLLAERLVTELSAHDQRFQGELRRRAEAAPLQQPDVPTSATQAQRNNDVVSPMQEDERHYYTIAAMGKGKGPLQLHTVSWLKEPLRSWVTRAETQAPMIMAAVSSNYTLPVIAIASGNCTDDTWTATSTTNAPGARDQHTVIWTGSEMIVWGGGYLGSGFVNTGGRYNPATDSWTATSTTNAPSVRYHHTAVWTGTEMIVWGGSNSNGTSGQLNTGGRYNPSLNRWTATNVTDAPAARESHTAVWTGTQMIVWGGYAGYPNYELNTGGRYNLSTDTWTPTSTANAPDARYRHTAVWTGTQMIVWGGDVCESGGCPLKTGGRYNPGTDTWAATSTTNAPEALLFRTAVWTGSEMIVWGGGDGGSNTGGRYNPGTNVWTATSIPDALYPPPLNMRTHHTAVWTGSEMIVWGGHFGLIANTQNTGLRYNPSTDSWTATSTANAPGGRLYHTAIWTGTQMVVWGGWSEFNGGDFNTGGKYCAAPPPPSASNIFGISTRSHVETSSNAMFGGFSITGQPQKVVIRAVGPALAQYGVPGVLADPQLTLYNAASQPIARNDNWQTPIFEGTIVTENQVSQIQSSGFAPSSAQESVIIATLAPGDYTAVVTGVSNTTGVALVQMYGLPTHMPTNITGISTRGHVETSSNAMFGGFSITGQPQKVVIRAVGPALAQYGVPGVLADPQLTLYNAASQPIARNDNWQTTIVDGTIITANQISQIQSSGFAPSSAQESVIIATLAPGDYTAVVTGVNNTTGVALVQVYTLP